MTHTLLARATRRALFGLGVATLLGVSTLAAAPAAAQAFPTKPIRIIVGSPAGGGGDTIARLVTQAAAPLLGQTFIIENRAGAGGNIAADLVAKSPADGYTLLLAFTGHVINPGLYKKLAFNTAEDFAPVVRLARNQTLLVVRNDMPARNLGEFIAMARQRPGQIGIASLTGSSQHLAGELMQSMAKIDLLTIPYRGNAAALNDVMGGQVEAMFSTVTVAGPFVKSGKLRALAIAGASRSPMFPEVPTIAEAGVPGFASEGWYGLLAPKGTPPAVVDKLYAAFAKALEQPQVRQALAAGGNEPAVQNPAEFDKFIRAEIPRWGEVIRKARIELE